MLLLLLLMMLLLLLLLLLLPRQSRGGRRVGGKQTVAALAAHVYQAAVLIGKRQHASATVESVGLRGTTLAARPLTRVDDAHRWIEVVLGLMMMMRQDETRRSEKNINDWTGQSIVKTRRGKNKKKLCEN